MPNQITHPWTDEEVNFLEENISKLTYKKMGDFIQRSPASIQSKVRYLPFKKKVKKHVVNVNFFQKWSAEMAYVMGFIAADGNVCHTGRAHMLHIPCDDRDVIEKIKIVLSYGGPIHEKSRLNGKVSNSLRICDQTIFKDLVHYGVTERKSLTYTPPVMPRTFVRHFVRGYFDGDGSVCIRKTQYKSKLRVYFYTGSLKMAQFLHKTMSEILGDLYGASINVKLAHGKTPFYVVQIGHRAGVILFKYMYRDTDLFLGRKYRKFLEGMNYGN